MQNPLRILLILTLGFVACRQGKTANVPIPKPIDVPTAIMRFDSSVKVIHVMVALCDNKYQGIVPVPVKIGNGQDADNNLYWGCSMGIKSFFKKSNNWKLVSVKKLGGKKLERLVFVHKNAPYYLVADAYDGRFIKDCTIDFFNSCAGIQKDTLHAANRVLGINGNARLLAYIGHDGLMDFSLTESFDNTDGKVRDAIMLACISKKYFAPHLKETLANPLLWSTGLMSPEAYTLHDALEMYISGKPSENVRNSAAAAYHRYQKCGINAARRLLVSGYQ